MNRGRGPHRGGSGRPHGHNNNIRHNHYRSNMGYGRSTNRGYYNNRRHRNFGLNIIGLSILCGSGFFMFIGIIFLMLSINSLGVILLLGGIVGLFVACMFRGNSFGYRNFNNNQNNNYNNNNNNEQISQNNSSNSMIDCAYCGTKNDNSLSRCCSCGAVL